MASRSQIVRAGLFTRAMAMPTPGTPWSVRRLSMVRYGSRTTSLGEVAGMIAVAKISIPPFPSILCVHNRAPARQGGATLPAAGCTPLLQKLEHTRVLLLADQLVARYAEATV